MALSGTFGQNYGSFLRIQGDWTATQDKAANTSTITLKTYWIDRGSASGVSAGSSNTGYSSIGGTQNSFTATAGLSRNQKKLINTQTRTISHSSDGTLSGVNLIVLFNPEITFSGSYYGTVSANEVVSLNTIPRESTIASDASWTAGGNETISISRGSTSFRHVTKIYVRNSSGTYIWVKDVSSAASEMYVSSSFTTAEQTQIFSLLNGRSSADTRLNLLTYSGSTLVGETLKYGTVDAPQATTVASGYTAYWFTDQSISIGLNSEHSDFTHTIRIKLGSYTKTLTGVTNTISWTPTTTEQNSLNAQMATVKSMTGAIEIDTFYNGVQVRNTLSRFINFSVRDANPNVTGTITYSDNNSSTVAITGNNQYLVQGKSTLTITLSASAATAQKGATLTEVIFTVGGVSQVFPWTTSARTAQFGTVNASTNQTIIVEVVDSRGNKGMVTKLVTMVPYNVPSLSVVANRVNGFEAATTVQTSGGFSPISVAGVTKNSITALRYRTRIKGGTWSAFTTLGRTNSGTTFVGTTLNLTLDFTKAHEVQVDVVDRLSTKTYVREVGIGRPILMIDDVLSSIGFNDFPKNPNEFLINGRLTFAANLYTGAAEGALGGAIDMNNGDIVRANGIYFNDISNNSGEGLLFARTNTPVGSQDSSLYDNFYIRDGTLYLNNIAYMNFNANGIIERVRQKESNGYNTMSFRDPTAHDDSMLMQSATGSISITGGQGSASVTWGTTFTSTPLIAIATSTNASSLNYMAAVYSLSSTGCTVWLRHRDNQESTQSATITFAVMAVGRRGT